METAINHQEKLETAIKRHFTPAGTPEFDVYLYNKILDRLNYEREYRALKPKLFIAIGVLVASVGLQVFAWGISWGTLTQTVSFKFFSLIFTDFRLVLANWQDYMFSILESLPLGTLAFLLGSIMASVWLMDFSSHKIADFRKLLSTQHYYGHKY